MNETRYIAPLGGQTRDDDHLFSLLVQDWEHEGVPTELIFAARPLLEGSAEQQALANTFLAEARGGHRHLPMLLDVLSMRLAKHDLLAE